MEGYILRGRQSLHWGLGYVYKLGRGSSGQAATPWSTEASEEHATARLSACHQATPAEVPIGEHSGEKALKNRRCTQCGVRCASCDMRREVHDAQCSLGWARPWVAYFEGGGSANCPHRRVWPNSYLWAWGRESTLVPNAVPTLTPQQRMQEISCLPSRWQ